MTDYLPPTQDDLPCIITDEHLENLNSAEPSEINDTIIYDNVNSCQIYSLPEKNNCLAPEIFIQLYNITPLLLETATIELVQSEPSLWEKIEEPFISITSLIGVITAATYSTPLAVTMISASTLSFSALGIAKWQNNENVDEFAKFIIKFSQGTVKIMGMYILSDVESPKNIKQYITPVLETVVDPYIANILTIASISCISAYFAHALSDVENVLMYSDEDSKKLKHQLEPFFTERGPLAVGKRAIKEVSSDAIEKYIIKEIAGFKVASMLGHFNGNFPIAVWHNKLDAATFIRTFSASFAKYFGEYITFFILENYFHAKYEPKMNIVYPKYISLVVSIFSYVAVQNLAFRIFPTEKNTALPED